jgi:hypothetical protein
VRIVALEASVGGELDIEFGEVVTNIDLREPVRAGGKALMTELAQLAGAPHRHVSDLLAFFEIDVQHGRPVTELAPYGGVDPFFVFGKLHVVAHLTGLVSEVSNLPDTVIVDRRAPVPAILAPGVGNEKRSAENEGDHNRNQHYRGAENMLRVDEWAFGVHLTVPPCSRYREFSEGKCRVRTASERTKRMGIAHRVAAVAAVRERAAALAGDAASLVRAAPSAGAPTWSAS